MAKPNENTVNFLSYNSTGFDSVKTKWVRDLLDTCKIACSAMISNGELMYLNTIKGLNIILEKFNILAP